MNWIFWDPSLHERGWIDTGHCPRSKKIRSKFGERGRDDFIFEEGVLPLCAIAPQSLCK
jgi:hypothetical protein